VIRVPPPMTTSTPEGLCAILASRPLGRIGALIVARRWFYFVTPRYGFTCRHIYATDFGIYRL
jgi:hypothetical protein